MQIPPIPFQTTDWNEIEPTLHAGEQGEAHWRTQMFGDIRVRIVDYSPGYLADHWCEKGHVLFCLEGELHTQLKGGEVAILKPGMSYQVGDGSHAHRSYSPAGAKLFIVD
jgi:quercetin dioxygenase-like cupin family protein